MDGFWSFVIARLAGEGFYKTGVGPSVNSAVFEVAKAIRRSTASGLAFRDFLRIDVDVV